MKYELRTSRFGIVEIDTDHVERVKVPGFEHPPYATVVDGRLIYGWGHAGNSPDDWARLLRWAQAIDSTATLEDVATLLNLGPEDTQTDLFDGEEEEVPSVAASSSSTSTAAN